jgi:hypothetical protein
LAAVLSVFYFYFCTFSVTMIPVAKAQRASSIAFSGFSDATSKEYLDDPAGITRSSLTQESYHNDSWSHTLGSSFSGSAKTLPQHSKTQLQVTPPDAPMQLHCDGADAAVAEASMDVFDLALAADVQQRRHRHRYGRRGHHRHHRTSHHGSSPVVVGYPVVATVSESAEGVTAGAEAAAAVVMTTGAGEVHHSSAAVAEETRRPQHHRRHSSAHRGGHTEAAPLTAIAVPSASSPASLTNTATAHHEAQMQHLKRLMQETRSLHQALWQQLQELQRQEVTERQQRHNKGRGYTA